MKHLGSQSILDVKPESWSMGTLVCMFYKGKLSHNAHASTPNDRFLHVTERDTCNQGKEDRAGRGERIGQGEPRQDSESIAEPVLREVSGRSGF